MEKPFEAINIAQFPDENVIIIRNDNKEDEELEPSEYLDDRMEAIKLKYGTKGELYFDPFFEFDATENKLHPNREVHALIYLASLIEVAPIQGADHDVIYLSGGHDEFMAMSDEQIIDLMRCGLHWSTEYDCLVMSA